MKINSSGDATTCSKKMAWRLRTACATRLLVLLLTMPAAGQAQDYTYTTNGGAITITGYSGPGGTVTIPSTINGLPVTSIGNSAFYNKIFLTNNVTIGNSVNSIGYYAFGSCASPPSPWATASPTSDTNSVLL